MNNQPHLNISAKDISPIVLLPGDPARVQQIGALLNKFQIIAENREFRIGTGFYNNQKITVCSTGIGCPSTAIAAEELINAGANILIRVGTCGGAWRADIPPGSLVIPTASIRDEGTTQEYIPQGFPAVADIAVVNALIQSATRQRVRFFVGINRTHDAFYGEEKAIKKWGNYLCDDRWKNADTPILSSEMESAALFIIATLRGVKAGAILAVNASPESLKSHILGEQVPVVTEDGSAVTKQTVEKMIIVTLNALKNIQ